MNRAVREGVIFLDLFDVRRRLDALRSDRYRTASGAAAADGGSGSAVRGLVMVASSSWEWPVDTDAGERHGALLRDLVAALPESRRAMGRPVVPDGTDGPQRPGRRRSRDTAAVIRWRWTLDGAVPDAVEEVAAELAALRDAYRKDPGAALDSAGARLHHRLYLDGANLRGSRPALADAGPGLEFHVVLDFAFTTYLDQLTCVLSVSVWSRYPFLTQHAPAELGPPDEPRPDGVEIAGHVDLFEAVRADMEAWFAGCGLARTEFRIRGREYRLPTIWVAVPAAPADDASDYLSASLPMLNRLSGLVLRVGDTRDCVITPSVLNGQVLALRHLEAVDAEEPILQPNYLLVPERAADPDRNGRHQEALVSEIIRALIALEGEAASRLWHIQADVDVWTNQLNVYNEVAERGLALWDALSTHLPVRRGRQLERVHRSVELIHQVLLQGVADLARMETRTQDAVANATRATTELLEAYDGVITEYHDVPNGLRLSLARTGVVHEVQSTAERAVQQAARVKAKYDHLLGAMSHAFDERRVRESDVLQRASGKVGFALAFIGVITVLDATVQMKPESLQSGALLLRDHAWLSRAALVTSLLLGFGFLALVCWVGLRAFGEGPLGSPAFRRIYNGARSGGRRTGMWQFLRDSSSDELDRLRMRPLSARPDEWREVDDDLSARFAALWDEIAAAPGAVRSRRVRWRPGDTRDVADDIRLLAQRIEQWGLWTLLVTERPFGTLARYRLPRLTLLYRACTLLPTSFLAGTSATVVSEDDCRRSLQQLGLTRTQAAETDAALVRWAGAAAHTATDVVALLDGWGVHAGVGTGDLDAVLAEVRDTGPETTKPAAR